MQYLADTHETPESSSAGAGAVAEVAVAGAPFAGAAPAGPMAPDMAATATSPAMTIFRTISNSFRRDAWRSSPRRAWPPSSIRLVPWLAPGWRS
jgi:hypothetical protein